MNAAALTARRAREQVRAGSLQELVYKQGQAGVTKASVSIVFNNSDPERSPVGYEHCEQITVTRQARRLPPLRPRPTPRLTSHSRADCDWRPQQVPHQRACCTAEVRQHSLHARSAEPCLCPGLTVRTAGRHSRVQNLFHSVQLNVNNPHFLIMQGRITKVLNMKPPEILSMLEEARAMRCQASARAQALTRPRTGCRHAHV